MKTINNGTVKRGNSSKSLGQCQCAKVTFSLELPQPLADYSARACDCDFCMQRGIAYLSHPDGAVVINCAEPLVVNRQGSEQAMFVACGDCGTVIAAMVKTDDGLIGAVNAGLLDEAEQLQAAIVVSPKLLDAEDKLARWKSVWLAVDLNTPKLDLS